MNPNCLNTLKQKKIDDKLLHEKRRSNLFQNKYSAEIKKKHERFQESEDTKMNVSLNLQFLLMKKMSKNCIMIFQKC